MISVQTTVNDFATPAVRQQIALLTPQRLQAAAGPRLALLTQTHLRNNGTNKKGWPSTHFYADAARATHWQPVAGGVVVSIAKQGMRQRVQGGPIRPVNARALAIPISPVSYGHLPGEFPGLFLLKTAKGAFLAQHGEEKYVTPKGTEKWRALRQASGGNAKPRLAATLNVLFMLSLGVDQAGDPSLIPSRGQLAVAAIDAIQATAIKRKGSRP